MENKKEMTAFGSSVGADERQPIQKCNNNSITLKTAKFNIIVLEFPQIYPQNPNTFSFIINNFQKTPKI